MGADLASAPAGGSSWRSAAPVALVVVTPLAVAPGAHAPFASAKWFAVCGLVTLGLTVAAATGRLRWPLARWWALWLGVLSASAVLGVAPWMSLAGSPGRNAGLLAALIAAGAFVLGASVGGDRRAPRRILRAAFVTGGIVGTLAVLERIGVALPGLDDAGEVSRARSTWGSATFLGGYLVLVLPVAVVHLRAGDRRWRRLALASSVAMAAGLLLSGTRGAWLGAIAALAVLAPVLPRRDRHATRGAPTGERLPALVPWALGGVAVGVLVLAVAQPALGRATAAGRLDLWRITMPVIAEHPVLGAGPDTQRIVLPSGIDDDFEREHGSEELHDRAHNLVLDAAVTTGLLGVASLGALLVAVARRVRALLGSQVTGRAIAAGLVGYVVHLLFAFQEATLDPLAWLLAGVLVAGLANRSAAEGAAASARPARWAPVVLGAGSVVALCWAGGELLADHRLARAVDQEAAGDRLGAIETLHDAQRTAPARMDLWQVEARTIDRLLTGGSPTSGRLDPRRSESARSALVESGLQALDRADRIAPHDPDLQMDLSSLLTSAGRLDEAARALAEVLRESYPSSSRALLGRGLIEAADGRSREAVRSWEQAALLAPTDARPLVNLGILHAQAGRTDEAIDAFQRALDRDPNEPTARRALVDLGVASPDDRGQPNP